MTTLTFIGATQQVTGSCYLLETEQSAILLECGMYQGTEATERLNRQAFPFDARKIDAVVVSHTHLDHCGLLPKLVKLGFRGPIYLTKATFDLIEIMLKDAAFLEMKDTEWENRQRRRAGRDLIEPLYTDVDVDKTLGQRQTVPYHQATAIRPDIRLTYREAGHILGSATVELQIQDGGRTRALVFSGDLGNDDAALLKDPTAVDHADVLLLESTYGDRRHRSMEDTVREFEQALGEAFDHGGNVLIPAFAVGRTQEVLYWLGRFYREQRLKPMPVFLDSPMAIAASDVYFRHLDLFNKDDAQRLRQVAKDNWRDWLPQLRCTRTTEESMEINSISGGAVIIAGSGMCSGGRIRHHLKNNLWRNDAHVIIVGFQAQGTLGRALVDGAERVHIFGKEIAVNATIHTLGGFSAHADQQQLLNWAARFRPPLPELYLIHGELDKMLVLQRECHRQLDWYANIPSPGDKLSF